MAQLTRRLPSAGTHPLNGQHTGGTETDRMSLTSGRASSRPRAALLCGILLLSCEVVSIRAVHAAEDPDADFSLKETVQVGPFHMAPFFVLKDFGYDDNTRLDARRSSGDFMVTFGPGARAVAPVGRLAAFSIWDEIDYAVFARESDLNHVNNSLRTKLHLYLRDFTVYALSLIHISEPTRLLSI